MAILSAVFGLLVLAIYGITSFDNTTYYDVHPEQNKYVMRDFSSSSEPSVADYSVENMSEYETARNQHFLSGFVRSTRSSLSEYYM